MNYNEGDGKRYWRSTFWKASAVITGLVILQQLAAKVLFGSMVDWESVPVLILVNMGIVAFWLYIKTPNKKLPNFLVLIAAVCLTVGVHIVFLHLGFVKTIVPAITSFFEKQWSYIALIGNTPQFFLTVFVTILVLILLPSAKRAYKRFVIN